MSPLMVSVVVLLSVWAVEVVWFLVAFERHARRSARMTPAEQVASLVYPEDSLR